MKTNIRTILTAALALVIGFTSCKKNNNNPLPDGGKTAEPRLMLMEVGTTQRIHFNYNEAGRMTFYNLTQENYHEEFHFGYEEGTNKLINGVYDNLLEIYFIYQGGQLDKVEYRYPGDANNEIATYDKYFYENGKVSYKLSYVKTEGGDLQPSNKTAYTYYANGDVKTEIRSYLYEDTYVMTSRYEYEYDDKVNAIQAQPELYYVLGIPKSAHNIKTSKLYTVDNELDETKTYSINYNGFNLPTTGVENCTYPNSPAINKTIKYSYQ